MKQSTGNFLDDESMASFCYFYMESGDKCLLPIVSNKYEINIRDKFAEIKSVQTYRNPFSK